MKKLLLAAIALTSLTLHTHSTEARDKFGNKRTDGPRGSEYGNFDRWLEGDVSLGAKFGAVLYTSGKHSSFSLGIDVDYRPFDLFGARLSYTQGVQSPRSTFINFAPLVHTQFSNLKPFALFGPGIAIVNHKGGTSVKFDVGVGAGADIEILNHFGFGMEWVYHFIVDSTDAHTLSARFSYLF